MTKKKKKRKNRRKKGEKEKRRRSITARSLTHSLTYSLLTWHSFG